jgi:hypothetical protein
MKKHVFVLGYNANDYFTEWFNLANYSDEYQFYFIDNGRQQLNSYITDNFDVYTTTTNIGCAGGWNFICDIAFKHMGLEKVIVSEEDSRFSLEILDALWDNSTATSLATTYNNGFGYALYCMHRDIFNTVGRFDENILWAGCEDNDYDHRCKLHNVQNINLNVPSMFNGNSTSTDPNSPSLKVGQHNADYVKQKWGNYEYTTPFNGTPPFEFDPLLEQHFGKLTEFPSVTEFKNYTQQ